MTIEKTATDILLALSKRDVDATTAVQELETLQAENARLRAELAAAPRWISVTERLPGPRKSDDDLLARRENGWRVDAMYDGSSWWEFDHELQDWIPLVGVTHWYQVPALEVKP